MLYRSSVCPFVAEIDRDRKARYVSGWRYDMTENNGYNYKHALAKAKQADLILSLERDLLAKANEESLKLDYDIEAIYALENQTTLSKTGQLFLSVLYETDNEMQAKDFLQWSSVTGIADVAKIEQILVHLTKEGSICCDNNKYKGKQGKLRPCEFKSFENFLAWLQIDHCKYDDFYNYDQMLMMARFIYQRIYLEKNYCTAAEIYQAMFTEFCANGHKDDASINEFEDTLYSSFLKVSERMKKYRLNQLITTYRRFSFVCHYVPSEKNDYKILERLSPMDKLYESDLSKWCDLLYIPFFIGD